MGTNLSIEGGGRLLEGSPGAEAEALPGISEEELERRLQELEDQFVRDDDMTEEELERRTLTPL